MRVGSVSFRFPFVEKRAENAVNARLIVEAVVLVPSLNEYGDVRDRGGKRVNETTAEWWRATSNERQETNVVIKSDCKERVPLQLLRGWNSFGGSRCLNNVSACSGKRGPVEV